MSTRLALLLVLVESALAMAHEFPRPTKQGVKELVELIDGCVREGGLKVAKDRAVNQGEPYYVPADSKRLRQAIAARRGQITPALTDALIGGWQMYDEHEEPFAIALLQAIGEECKDDRAFAFAALFQAGRATSKQRFHSALDHYKEAERRFAEIQDIGWQATALHNLGLTQANLSNLPEALAYYEQSYRLRVQRYGADNAVVATSLNNIGVVRYRQGDFIQAATDHEKALAIRRKAFKTPHRLIALSLLQLGMDRLELHQYDRAETHFREALTNLRAPADRDLIAEANNNLGGLYEYRGEYGKGLAHYRRAGDMWLELYGTLRHPLVALSLNNLGSIHAKRGELNQAQASLETALRLFRELKPGDDRGTAGCLDNLMNVELHMGHVEAALRDAQEALEMWKRLYKGNHSHVARAWNNLGGVYEKQGDFDQAVACYHRALQMWDKIYRGGPHPDLARCLDNLAQAYYRHEEPAQAVRYARRANQLFEKLYPSGHPERAGALGNEAWHFLQVGRFDEASLSLDKALTSLREAGSGTNTRPRLANLPDTVKLLYLRGLAEERRLGDAGSAEDWRRCAAFFSRAVEVLEQVRDEVLLRESSRLQLGEEVFHVFPHLVGAYQRLYERDRRSEHLEAAFSAIEQGTARRFLAALGQARATVIGGVSADLRRQEADLRQQLDDLEGRLRYEYMRPAGQEDPERVRALLAEQRRLETAHKEILGSIESRYPRYARFRSTRPCTLAEARACLGADEVALLYLPGENTSYLLLVEGQQQGKQKNSGLALYRLPDEGSLAASVATLTDPETLQLPGEARGLGAELYQVLLAPIADRIRGKHLVILPGGMLGRLPFEMLVEGNGESQGNYLIERHRVRYAPSFTILHLGREWSQSRKPPNRELWALGDPLYAPSDPRWPADKPMDAVSQRWAAAQGVKNFPPLRFSREEIDAIRAVFSGTAHVRLGDAATESSVKADSAAGRLAEYRYVHFSAHGLAFTEAGQASALVLSLVGNDGRIESGGANDGFLQLDEVTNLKLNADLTVLSACGTGQGRVFRSEGVIGLSRSFLYAGSRGVVCSLWSVDDRQTALLMKDIYRRLKDSPTAAAVRAAKRQMIEAGKAPFYWAPFVLIGE